MPLRIACLGQLSLQRDGAVLSGAGTQPRRLAMLAVLAHAGERGVSRERLLALLWPDTDEERARRGVTQALYALRQELGSEDAIAGTKDLRLDPELVGSDLDQFRRAASAREWARAAAAWGGPFLDGFTLPGAPEFERWADEERAALAHEYAQVLEQAAEAEAKSGDYARAAAWWRRLAAHDPFNARVAMRLMHSLADAGDRAGAIRHAAIYQALVEQELEMGADPAVQELADALRKAPARGPSPAPAPSPTPAPAPASEQSAPVTSADEPARAPAPPRGARPVRRFPAAWLTAAVLAFIALGLFTAVRLRRARAVSLDGARVIVAPLENRTGDAE